MHMRIFLALPFSQQLYPETEALQTKFSNFPVRWLKNSNLHTTLVPPWEIAETQLEELIQKLYEIETPRPFTVEFNRFSAGPNPKSPRLLWATGKHSPSELLKLKSDLEHTVKYRPDRGFTLHTTLARFNRDSLELKPELANISEPIHWNMLVKEFVIMQSVLTNKGAEYNIIHSFPFHE